MLPSPTMQEMRGSHERVSSSGQRTPTASPQPPQRSAAVPLSGIGNCRSHDRQTGAATRRRAVGEP